MAVTASRNILMALPARAEPGEFGSIGMIRHDDVCHKLKRPRRRSISSAIDRQAEAIGNWSR